MIYYKTNIHHNILLQGIFNIQGIFNPFDTKQKLWVRLGIGLRVKVIVGKSVGVRITVKERVLKNTSRVSKNKNKKGYE